MLTLSLFETLDDLAEPITQNLVCSCIDLRVQDLLLGGHLLETAAWIPFVNPAMHNQFFEGSDSIGEFLDLTHPGCLGISLLPQPSSQHRIECNETTTQSNKTSLGLAPIQAYAHAGLTDHRTCGMVDSQRES
jgi:hypothetical protein